MSRCQECQASQLEGTLFCGECGAALFGLPAAEALSLSDMLRSAAPPPVDGNPDAEAGMPLEFIIAATGRRLSVMLERELYIGRADPAQQLQPAVDLTPDSGKELGVSRLHAFIQRTPQGLFLIDLGSTNGTRLNGRRLAPDLPQRLQSGDEIHLGDLAVQVVVAAQ